jgi:pilus assembly protein CpaC
MRGGRHSIKAEARFVAFSVALCAGLVCFACADRAGAADRPGTADRRASSGGGSAFVTEVADVQRVKVTLNKSRTFRLDVPFSTIVSGSSDIIDVKSLSDQLIYIQGKKTGTTNVLLFDASMRQIGIIDVEVTVDTANLEHNIRTSTGTQGIRVSASEGQVVLSGTAADAVAADRAMAIATGALAREGRDAQVVNAMSVAAPQQVMLEVRFLEVFRQSGRDLGVNLFGANASGSQVGVSGLGNVIRGGRRGNPGLPPTPNGLPDLVTAGTLASGATPYGSLLTQVMKLSNGTTLDALITALETKGALRRLAEPNLIALSGDTARFLAGGEFPVPIPNTSSGGFPTISIDYKKFGVELAFVPTVLSRGVINLRVEPSVSELDFANAVTIAGTTVPSLTRRDARTTVELRDGQSFAIAGLLQSRNRQDVSQLPWIGSVPVLGTLFRSSSYQQEETDLVIIVTPRLIAPVVPGQRLASPLDSRLPANDLDFFLNGQVEVRKRYNDYVNSGGELKGPYGHLIPPEASAAVVAPVVIKQPALK